MVGFVGTSVLATLLLLFNYLLAYNPIIDDLSSGGTPQESRPGLEAADAISKPNPVDVGCVTFFRRLFRIGGKWRLTTTAFEQFSLTGHDVDWACGGRTPEKCES